MIGTEIELLPVRLSLFADRCTNWRLHPPFAYMYRRLTQGFDLLICEHSCCFPLLVLPNTMNTITKVLLCVFLFKIFACSRSLGSALSFTQFRIITNRLKKRRRVLFWLYDFYYCYLRAFDRVNQFWWFFFIRKLLLLVWFKFLTMASM